MEVVFSTSAIALFPDVLEDGGSIDILNSIDPDDVKIDRVVCVGIGAKAVRPHLLVRADCLLRGLAPLMRLLPGASRQRRFRGLRSVPVRGRSHISQGFARCPLRQGSNEEALEIGRAHV